MRPVSKTSITENGKEVRCACATLAMTRESSCWFIEPTSRPVTETVPALAV